MNQKQFLKQIIERLDDIITLGAPYEWDDPVRKELILLIEDLEEELE